MLRTRAAFAATPLARETAAAVCAVLERTGQEALAYSVKGGHLYVYYKEFACDFERSFVSSRIHSPYKTFVQVEHYPEALAGGDTLMFLLALPGAEEARAFYDIFRPFPGLSATIIPTNTAAAAACWKSIPKAAPRPAHWPA